MIKIVKTKNVVKIQEMSSRLLESHLWDITDNNSQWWFAKEEGKIVGFAGLRKSVTEKNFGFLCLSGVEPEARGQGIQKKLIDARLRAAKKLGYKGVITYVAAENNPSLNSLIKKGFRFYTPEDEYAGSEYMYLKKEF